MYSNWNVLTLPIKADGKYKIGDTYHVSDRLYPKFWKFDGLVILMTHSSTIQERYRS